LFKERQGGGQIKTVNDHEKINLDHVQTISDPKKIISDQ
jgi:hypothetical protein